MISVGQRPDWGTLYAQGRVKAFGVPWTEEEKYAKNPVDKGGLGIPVEYVRDGILTIEAYEEILKKEAKVEKDTGEKPVERLTADELMIKADELGVHVTPHAPKDVLVNLVKKAATSNKTKRHV